jgi:hypothetical protein
MSSPPFFQRNRTRRANSPHAGESTATPAFAPAFAPAGAGAGAGQDPMEQNQELENFLNLNANNAYRRPWHKMERGFHLNRLRKFVDTEKARLNLCDEDVVLLQTKLEKAYDKKLLKSKTYVIYDPEKEEIQEIKGLVYHKTAEGRMLSNLMEKKGVTFRRKPAQNMKAGGDKVEEAPHPTA